MSITANEIDTISKGLSHSQVFNGIQELALQDLVKAATVLKLEPGAFLVEEEHKVLGLYVLLEGAADVYKGQKIIFTFGRGSFFGEISLFGVSFGATATVKAREKAKFLLVTRPVLDQWAKLYPAAEQIFLRRMCTELCRRLYSTSERLS